MRPVALREENVRLHTAGGSVECVRGVPCLTRPGTGTTLVHFYPPTSSLLFLSYLQCPPQIPQAKVCSFSIPLPSTLMPSLSASPTITTSQPSSPHDLRHIISTGALTPQKDSVRERERKLSAHPSQHLGLRVGSRSPTSIPSSPTSV